MPSIFISYRREDTEGDARHLFEVLTNHYGKDSVFLDVEAIQKGRDFRVEIDKSVSTCSVLLALIGKTWLDQKNEAGDRRLDNLDDFVRLETASALKRDIPVMPVLLHGATMPRADQLPGDLKDLAYRNGVELTHARWHSDLDLLLRALDPYVKPTPAPALRKPWWRSRLTIQISLLVTTVMAVAIYLNIPRSTSINNQAPIRSGPMPGSGDAGNVDASPDHPGGAQTGEESGPKQLPAPRLLSPENGVTFDRYPRTTTLTWAAVTGAKNYRVEWAFIDSGGMCPASPTSNQDVVLQTSQPSYTFDFIGAQPGCWRVSAIDEHGKVGPTSSWWKFTYSK